ALDTARNRLYVMQRIDHTIGIVSNASLASRALTGTVSLHFDPSPPAARIGRRFLYDATNSGHGDSACASCHIFGDFDSLAWHFAAPVGPLLNTPNPRRRHATAPPPSSHPRKGPMPTQSLRAIAAAGPMHWRGDRTAGNDPGGDPLDEAGAFKKF